MGIFVRGDVVDVPFPFSDLTQNKRRPAFVVRRLPGDDVILCQITSRQIHGVRHVCVTAADFGRGGLRSTSYVKPGHLFTADSRIVVSVKGSLLPDKIDEIIGEIVDLIRN